MIPVKGNSESGKRPRQAVDDEDHDGVILTKSPPSVP